MKQHGLKPHNKTESSGKGGLREGQCGWKVRKGQERRESEALGGEGAFSTNVAVRNEMGCECQIHTGF